MEHCAGSSDLSELAIVRAQRVALRDLPSLGSLQDFLEPELSELEELHLSSLPSLQTLAGLEHLTTLQVLSVTSCEGIRDLTGLDGLREVQQTMLLRDDAQLASLAGGAKLENIGSLELHGNAQLTSLRGLAGVELGNLQLTGLPVLRDLTGLEAISTLWKLTLEDNAQLADIAALAKLEAVEDRLLVANNPMLLDLHGLEGLRSVTAEITDNQTLEEVRALGGVTRGSVTLMGNAKLAQCEIDWLMAHAAVTVAADGNGPAGSCAE